MTKKAAKYLNSPESEIYHKSRTLYGIYFAKKSIVQHNRCYLVEGYLDVISFHRKGIENTVASFRHLSDNRTNTAYPTAYSECDDYLRWRCCRNKSLLKGN